MDNINKNFGVVKDPKEELLKVVNDLRLDLEKMKFDLSSFKILLNAFF